MIAKKLKELLDANRIRYVTITHSPAYTAQELAQEVHVPGKELAKSVILEADGQAIMVVLAAPERLDLEKLRQATGIRDIEFASEERFADLFPGCERGAAPPFGCLYDLPLYVDRRLAEDEEIVFHAGSHVEAIRMKYADYARIARPRVADLAMGSR
ncbi:MAG: YbaK/EbsC family protein [Planctomycetes bacterium]|nr:YbaK/EbsC family protein [Planctomycetota bacterium]